MSHRVRHLRDERRGTVQATSSSNGVPIVRVVWDDGSSDWYVYGGDEPEIEDDLKD